MRKKGILWKSGFFYGLISGLVLSAFFAGMLMMVSKTTEALEGCAAKHDFQVSQPSGSASILDALSDREQKEVLAYLRFKETKTSFIPTGTPEIYGQELNISFDQVQDAINKVEVFGPTYGEEGKKIILTGQDLERYIDIGSQIACQYCCGATILVKKDGEAACGCDHSIMMRGLTAYLIKNHPQEFSDEQILRELTKWKITYFPKQTLSARLQEMEKEGEPGIKEILEEFPEFLPEMVGGC